MKSELEVGDDLINDFMILDKGDKWLIIPHFIKSYPHFFKEVIPTI